MKKYVKIVDNLKKTCIVGTGKDIEYYKRQGYIQKDVEQSDLDGNWYLVGYAPMKTAEHKAQEERERIKELSMTRSDFFDATIKAFGADESDFLPIIENILKQIPDTLQIMDGVSNEVAVKIALNNYKNAAGFYRKHPLFTILSNVPIQISEALTITITSEQWDKFFDETDKKNPDAYKELLPKDEN